MSDKYSNGKKQILTRAYEIGFTALANYCIDQYEAYSPEKAQKRIENFIDQFYNKNVYQMILDGDKKAIEGLIDQLKEIA